MSDDPILQTLALDHELLTLERDLARLAVDEAAAKEAALSELADVQAVESGPTAWWLTLTGGRAERVAKERAEADAAVGALRLVQETARALGLRLAEVREARHGRPDPLPLLHARAQAEPALGAAHRRCVALEQAVREQREVLGLLERARAQLVAAAPRERRDRPVDRERLALYRENLGDAQAAVDRATALLAPLGVPGPADLELGVDPVAAELIDLSGLPAHLDAQRARVKAWGAALGAERAAAVGALLALATAADRAG
jgi:hypothetical protein